MGLPAFVSRINHRYNHRDTIQRSQFQLQPSTRVAVHIQGLVLRSPAGTGSTRLLILFLILSLILILIPTDKQFSFTLHGFYSVGPFINSRAHVRDQQVRVPAPKLLIGYRNQLIKINHVIKQIEWRCCTAVGIFPSYWLKTWLMKRITEVIN